MNGVLGHDSALVRLYWAGDNLGMLLRMHRAPASILLIMCTKFAHLLYCFIFLPVFSYGTGRGRPWYSGSELDCCSTGRAIEPAPGV